jgi:hypothetical protein
MPSIKNYTYLSLVIILSIISSYIPQLMIPEGSKETIGADSLDYVRMLEGLSTGDTIYEVFIQSFVVQMNGDRPLSLLLFVLIVNVLNASDYLVAIELLPLLLSPLLVISVYCLSKEISSNDSTALLCSFLTVVSYQITVGIYGGLYANWFSLVLGFFSLTYLLKYLKKRGKHCLVIFSIIFICLFLSHSVSWTIFTLVIIIYLISLLFLDSRNRAKFLPVILIILLTISIDIGKQVLFDSSGIKIDLELANQENSGISQISRLWTNLTDTTQIFLGGLLGNSVFYIFAIYWICVSNIRKRGDLLLLIYLAIMTLPIFFGTSEIQSRVLYEIPVQIPAAIALSLIKYKGNTLFVIGICIWVLSIYFRSISNLHFAEL